MDPITQKHWFDSPEFQEQFHCDVPLGVFCSEQRTVFRLWAPTAESVKLRIYTAGTGGAPLESIAVTPAAKGLWVWETPRNLDGFYYDYAVTVDGMCHETVDPYACACGLNGLRGMILDLKRTDPDGWQEDAPPAPTPEQVIYELHVKDFSWDPAGGFAPEDRGRYSALCRTGTTLNNDGIHPTGIDYLKQLGVTHIQLLPVYDYGSVDEGGSDEQFNWGYDPVNYNIPEGSYSSDPHRGEVRIRELKEAIQSLHKHGFRVIMDVVYNHTYDLNVPLWHTVPGYFFRQQADGTLSNGSGCGNETASERSMCARYILDSVLYWAEEYHMDGFRFDLMGMLDTELMNNIQAALDKRFGVGEKLIYGEPWQGGQCNPRPGTVLCTKDNLTRLDPKIGAFCDATRDGVKGSVMDDAHPGFVNGGGISAGKLYHCVSGWAYGDHAYMQAPSQTISYLSCHDDFTLWDKLVCTLDPQRNFTACNPAIVRANRMAATINFFCQGHLFFLSGEEFGRTKGGVKNSYRSSPEINRLDWNRAWEYSELVEHYRGLIALRMQLPALQDKTPDAAKQILNTAEPAPGCASVTVRGNDTWKEVMLLCNSSAETRQLPLPHGTWQLLADDHSTFLWQTPSAHKDTISLPPYSAFILGSSRK